MYELKYSMNLAVNRILKDYASQKVCQTLTLIHILTRLDIEFVESDDRIVHQLNERLNLADQPLK
jgi:hypothetical protein